MSGRPLVCGGKPVIDRHGRIIHLGDRVRVCRCIGSYGQTLTEKGVVVDQSKEAPDVVKYSQFKYKNDKSQLQYGHIDYDLKTDENRCYHEHVSWEHGHKVWAEVIQEEEVKA